MTRKEVNNGDKSCYSPKDCYYRVSDTNFCTSPDECPYNTKAMTRKISKTFYKDDEISIPVNWIDNIIWAYTYNYEPRDPAEFETRLSNKIKVTIEIYNTKEDDKETENN